MIKSILAMMVLAAMFCGASLAITIDGNFDDWAGVPAIEDDEDMADSSGDIKMIQAVYEDGNLYLRMVVYGTILPTVDETPDGMENRYYYHWILDTDNDLDTGFNNSTYEDNPTNVDPIGVDVMVQVGWRDGAPNGIEAYTADDELLIADFDYAASGDSMEAVLPLEAIGISEGDIGNFSAFQEGASNDWQVDWLNPATLEFSSAAVEPGDKLATTWASVKSR